MEPVTAFGIACGTIQVVDFGTKVAYKVYRIVQSSSGTLKENEELETATVTLQGLMTALKAQSDPIPPSQTTRAIQNPGDIAISKSMAKDIRELASQCGETAQELIDLLNSIKVDPQKSTTSRTLEAVKKYPKLRKISKLKSRLEAHQKRLERHIIVELRGTSQALLRGTTQGFEDLQAEHKIIVKAIAKNESNIAKLIEVANAQTQHLITAEGERVRGEITIVGKRLDNAEYKQKLEEYKQKLELFIESFAFADMFHRENRMSRQPAAPRTFRWLFDKDYDAKRPYDSFMDWLEGDQTVYWFCGRAGSGKSTLMSFIWDHRDSKKDEYLQRWCPNGNLTTAAVFFWSQGSELQKSSEGLLRSLVYQLIRRNESQARRVMELWSESKDPHQEWTEARLLPILRSVLDEPDIRVCFFIDGLDEYGDGSVVANKNLLDLILDLTAYGNGRLKCCLSSRPLRPFELGLEKYPKLMLHKLTRPDITNYVRDSLFDATGDDLIKDIVDKANGIFLWAFFAVKSIRTAQINGDTSDQVLTRLHELPPELNDLYSHMLLQIDRVYWKEAALYFALAIGDSFDRLSVVHYVMASLDNYFEELMLPWTEQRVGALRKDCGNMEVWLKVRTAGLLEVVVSSRAFAHGIYGDVLSAEYDLSEDKTVNDDIFESQSAKGETADLPSTKLSQTELETYHGLLELHGDTKLTLKSQAILNGSSAEKAIEHSLLHRKVVAIHRSVVEFFESEEQNKLLQLCSKGTASLQRVQAFLVLLTLEHKLHPGMDRNISAILQVLKFSAPDAETYTEQPSRMYIDRLDSVVKAIKGPGWPANDPGELAMTFLGFTANCGLVLYVQDVLKNDLWTRNENRQLILNETLWCAVGFWFGKIPTHEVGIIEQSELIKFLLDEHADPNHAAPGKFSAGNMTVWGAFLGQAIKVLHWSSFYLTREPRISDTRDLLKSFISHEADSHQEFSHSFRPHSPHQYGYFDCKLHANATFVMEQFGLPCDPSQSRAVVETVIWRSNERQQDQAIYRLTPEGSAMLLEAFTARWDPWSSHTERDASEKEFYRRCMQVRRSAHDPDYRKPPLAECYPGSSRPTPEEEEWLDNC